MRQLCKDFDDEVRCKISSYNMRGICTIYQFLQSTFALVEQKIQESNKSISRYNSLASNANNNKSLELSKSITRSDISNTKENRKYWIIQNTSKNTESFAERVGNANKCNNRPDVVATALRQRIKRSAARKSQSRGSKSNKRQKLHNDKHRRYAGTNNNGAANWQYTHRRIRNDAKTKCADIGESNEKWHIYAKNDDSITLGDYSITTQTNVDGINWKNVFKIDDYLRGSDCQMNELRLFNNQENSVNFYIFNEEESALNVNTSHYSNSGKYDSINESGIAKSLDKLDSNNKDKNSSKLNNIEGNKWLIIDQNLTKETSESKENFFNGENNSPLKEIIQNGVGPAYKICYQYKTTEDHKFKVNNFIENHLPQDSFLSNRMHNRNTDLQSKSRFRTIDNIYSIDNYTERCKPDEDLSTQKNDSKLEIFKRLENIL